MATKILPISDLRRQATGIIKALREQGNVVYVTQHGRPTAVLVGYEEYEALVAQQNETEDRTEAIVADNEAGRGDDSFLTLAQSVNLDGPPDWSANLDNYLYGGKQIDGE